MFPIIVGLSVEISDNPPNALLIFDSVVSVSEKSGNKQGCSIGTLLIGDAVF